MALSPEAGREALAAALGREGQGGERVTLIVPSRGWRTLDLREVWRYRELFYFLVWRDVKVRYKQTALGVAWAVIQPVLTMVVFSVFFGGMAGVPSDGIPYPLFSLAALVPWTFFANGVTKSTNSLVGSQNLLKRVYFPRVIIPAAAVLGGIVDLGIAFAVLVAMLPFYGVVPGPEAVALPLFAILAFVTALGSGLWLSALNVQYRDVGIAIGFLIQIWLFVTPIAYPSSLLDQPWRTVYGLNPMAGVVEGFRWALLGADTAPGPVVLASAVGALLLLASGALYFRRMERTFADVV